MKGSGVGVGVMRPTSTKMEGGWKAQAVRRRSKTTENEKVEVRNEKGK
jgi:hypothetical protein